MIDDQEIIEALKARNYDCIAAGKALKIHPKKIEKVYKRFIKKNSKTDALQVTQNISNKLPTLPPEQEEKHRDILEIENSFLKKSYELKMTALEKIEGLLKTETDLSKLATIVRTLDGVTIEREPPSDNDDNNDFFKIS